MGEIHEMQIPEVWTCPRCGSQLAEPEAPHACSVYSVTTLFSSSDPKIYDLFVRFQELVMQLGDAKIFSQRTQIDFLAGDPSGGRVFSSVEPRQEWMGVTFPFRQREISPRFGKIEQVGPDEWLHTVRVADEGDLDAEFAGWLEQAYRQAAGG